jgi:hypothetical protein
MGGVASGLQRDLKLIRRRSWLFLPFFVVGILAALAFGRVAGDANATATLQLETVIHDLVFGGDRGLRIFEAQAMTLEPAFKEKVVRAGGASDHSRYVTSLAPISVADGVSKGILGVSIKDPDKATAEALRTAWVNTFLHEYTAADGLFRTRFVDLKANVARLAEQRYDEALKALQAKWDNTLPLDEALRGSGAVDSLTASLNREEARLLADAAEIRAALANAPVSPVLASALLGSPVPDGATDATLRARLAGLEAAARDVAGRRLKLNDSTMTLEVRDLLDQVRSAQILRQEAHLRLNNARVAVTSAQSNVEVSYSASGGVGGSLIGRIAIVVAVTLVFGLIAIYVWEWLSQVRAGSGEKAA